jgi:hypothetical protein
MWKDCYKRRKWNVRNRIFILLFVVLTLTACAQAVKSEPTVETLVPTDQVQPVSLPVTEVNNSASEGNDNVKARCIRNSDKTRLLINAAAGYCLQYPVDYDVEFNTANNVVLFISSPLDVTKPILQIFVQPAGGMTVEQAADKVAADYGMPGENVPQVEITLDGEKAIMLDGLVGQDPNRQVVVVHKDNLYTLWFIPMDKSKPDLFAQAEALYGTIVKSFNFHPEGNLCPDC